MGKPYESRTDLEKIQSQWNKLPRFNDEQQWSAAIVRAATATELAANFAIRKEFQSHSSFNSEFVDSLLLWANGLAGKIDRLLLPLTKGSPNHKTIATLKATAERINKKRNAIVHQGYFSEDDEASATTRDAKHFIETLIPLYEPTFALKDKKTKKHSHRRKP